MSCRGRRRSPCLLAACTAPGEPGREPRSRGIPRSSPSPRSSPPLPAPAPAAARVCAPGGSCGQLGAGRLPSLPRPLAFPKEGWSKPSSAKLRPDWNRLGKDFQERSGCGEAVRLQTVPIHCPFKKTSLEVTRNEKQPVVRFLSSPFSWSIFVIRAELSQVVTRREFTAPPARVRGDAGRFSGERSGETRAGSRRPLRPWHLSLRQRHGGSPAPHRSVSRPARPTPGPACGPRGPAAAAAGRLAGRGPAVAAARRGEPRRRQQPAPRGEPGAAGAGRGPCPQALGISRALLPRPASRPAEICHLLAPHRKLAGGATSALSTLRSRLVLPFWRPKLGCSPPRAAEDALRCPLCSA